MTASASVPNERSFSNDVTDPMQNINMFDKVQLTKLLIHTLRELGYDESAIKLQEESGGIQVESSIIQNLLKWIRAGSYHYISFVELAQLPLQNGRLTDDQRMAELVAHYQSFESNDAGYSEAKNSMKIENVITTPINTSRTIDRMSTNLEQFNDAIAQIQTLNLSSINIERIRAVLEISILICRQVFLELIFENKDFHTALILLRGTIRRYTEVWDSIDPKIEGLQDEQQTFAPEIILKDMSSLITCPNESIITGLWPNSLTKSRENLIQTISNYINPNDLVPKGRLLTLLRQAVKYQRSKDVFNFSEQEVSNGIEMEDISASKELNKYNLLQDNTSNFQKIAFENEKTLTQHSDEVWYLQFSPDGRYLASVSADATTDRKIYIYDVQNDFQVYKILSGNSQCILYLSFSPDSKLLVSCPFNAIVNIYSIHAEGEPIDINPESDNKIVAEVIKPIDSFYVLPGKEFKRNRSDSNNSMDGASRDVPSNQNRPQDLMATMESGSPLEPRSRSDSPSRHSINPVRIWCCDWFHTERHSGKFVVGSPDREVAIYDTNSSSVVFCFSQNTVIPSSIALQQNILGSSPISGGNALNNITRRDSTFSNNEIFPRVHDIKISNDDNSLILMTHQGKIDVYDISRLPSNNDNYFDIMAEYEKTIIPLASRLNVEKNMTCISIPKPGSFYDPALDSLLLVNLQSSEIQLWNYRENILIQKYFGQKQEQFIIRSCFGFENKLVASGSEDGKVYIWDRVRGNILGVLKAHVNDKPAQSNGNINSNNNKKNGKNCNTVVWNPADHNMFASGGDDGFIKVWKLVKD